MISKLNKYGCRICTSRGKITKNQFKANAFMKKNKNILKFLENT